MTLSWADARAALRRWLNDPAGSGVWDDAALDAALEAALAQLDQRAPREVAVQVHLAGAEELAVPEEMGRVRSLYWQGERLPGWRVWAGRLFLPEPLSGTLTVYGWARRRLPANPDQPLPLTGPAEEAFLLAAAAEQLLVQAVALQARWQGPVEGFRAALRAAGQAREQAAAALERRVRTRA